MDTFTADSKNERRTGTFFSKRLVELNEYARREGITPQQVVECSDIGIIQLRHHKGRTYVVDMPVCSFDNSEQIDKEVAKLLGIDERNQGDTAVTFLSSPILPTPEPRGIQKTDLPEPQREKPQDEQSPPVVEPGSIHRLVERMLEQAERIKTEHHQIYSPDKGKNGKGINCEQTESLIRDMHRRLDEIETYLDVSKKRQQFPAGR